MPQLMEREQAEGHPPRERERAVKVFARSIYKELRSNGYDARQMVALATELIGLVTADMKDPSVDPDEET